MNTEEVFVEHVYKSPVECSLEQLETELYSAMQVARRYAQELCARGFDVNCEAVPGSIHLQLTRDMSDE